MSVPPLENPAPPSTVPGTRGRSNMACTSGITLSYLAMAITTLTISLIFSPNLQMSTLRHDME